MESIEPEVIDIHLGDFEEKAPIGQTFYIRPYTFI